MNQILNILSSVGFNWHVAIANFVNFLIILFLLNKFFFGKIGKTLDDRHKVIEEGLSHARDAEMKLANAAQEKEDIIQSAYKEKTAILEEAEGQARDLASTIEKEAQETISRRMEKLDKEEQEIESKVEKAFALRAPHLVAAMYSKTLLKELTEEENNSLITRMNA